MSDTAALPIPAGLTEGQATCLRIIDQNNAALAGWFFRSTIMSVCQIESAFRQFARRYEPTIHDASYGYMQLLSSTARDLGYNGPSFPHMPDADAPPAAIVGTLYDPLVNVTLGMTYLHDGWSHLAAAFGRDPTMSELFAGYNEGYGAAARGRPDPAYVHVALAAFDRWLDELGERDRFTASGIEL